MKSLIHFRDEGCQGAKDILNIALNLASNTTAYTAKPHSAKRIIYLAKNQDNIIKINIYKEISTLLNIEFIFSNTKIAILAEDILIIEKNFGEIIEECKDSNALALIVEENENDFSSTCAISGFTSYVYTAIRNNKSFKDISINWIGDAGTQYFDYAKYLLNSTVCMENYLGYAFENNTENFDACMVHKDTLDFVMNARAKVFLSHDATVLDEDADIIYISHWSHNTTGQNISNVSHPFTYEAVQKEYSKNAQIISLIPDIKSTPIMEGLYNKVALNVRLVAVSYLITK